MSRFTVPLFAAACALAAACGGTEQRPPEVASKAPPVAVTRTTSLRVATPPPESGVHVAGDILAACKIDVGNVEKAPKFDFDRSELRGNDGDVLAQVASCVTTGPLKGRSLMLVGRADPRGEVEYNFVLGAQRAGSVRDYLTGLGVAGDKLDTTSRGKLDAIGTDDEGWQRDRRVDIDLK
jgi:peptidoglycan-associated lipoprotein